MSAPIDPAVAAVLDKHKADLSDDEDALIASLDEDDDPSLAALREQRLTQLHSEFTRAKIMRESGNGTYVEVKDEKQLMDITTSVKLVVVHFFKSDFGRCLVMDKHLEVLTTKHFDTRFLKISVENAPFLVTKLNVRVLPCVIAFVDGIVVDRIIGFEGLGTGDRFGTKDLEWRLLKSGVLVRGKMSESDGVQAAPRKNNERNENEDEDDWD